MSRGLILIDSHREQLKSLAVKASLIVPILQGDRLFGLLIGHQCQQTRIWNSSEIDLFTQLALQLGSALDRVKLREELDLAKRYSKQQSRTAARITSTSSQDLGTTGRKSGCIAGF